MRKKENKEEERNPKKPRIALGRRNQGTGRVTNVSLTFKSEVEELEPKMSEAYDSVIKLCVF